MRFKEADSMPPILLIFQCPNCLKDTVEEKDYETFTSYTCKAGCGYECNKDKPIYFENKFQGKEYYSE